MKVAAIQMADMKVCAHRSCGCGCGGHRPAEPRATTENMAQSGASAPPATRSGHSWQRLLAPPLNQRIDRCTTTSNSSHGFTPIGSALMPTPSILVATWDNGLFSVTGKMVRQELADQSVRGLVADGHGGVLAIAGGHSLCGRSSDGEWTEIAKSEFELSCCVPIGDVVFVGTDDAHILRVDPDGA